MKKILIIMMMFLLCACSSNAVDPSYDEEETNTTVTTSEFIEPVSSEDIFEYLNYDTKQLLLKANDNKDVGTSVLTNLGKELLDESITDYNGNIINLSDYKDSKLVIEVVASWCSHCKEQALNYNEDLLNSLGSDVTLIQYFANGDKSNIDAFYKEVGVDMPSNIIVGVNDDTFSNKMVAEYNLSLTPTFFFFNNGVLTWQTTGTLTSSQYELFKDIAFNNALDLNTLTDEDGKDIFDYIRDEEDVKNDLSEANYSKLEELDNDSYTISYTLKYMGQDKIYSNQLSDDSDFTSEVKFIDYSNKDLIVVFIDGLENEYIDLVNNFYNFNKDINIVVLNTSDENNEALADYLDVPYCSIMNQVPEVFNTIEFVSYPSALFIKNGTITGAYSNIESSDKLLEAYNLFLGDNSIALKANN